MGTSLHGVWFLVMVLMVTGVPVAANPLNSTNHNDPLPLLHKPKPPQCPPGSVWYKKSQECLQCGLCCQGHQILSGCLVQGINPTHACVYDASCTDFSNLKPAAQIQHDPAGQPWWVWTLVGFSGVVVLAIAVGGGWCYVKKRRSGQTETATSNDPLLPDDQLGDNANGDSAQSLAGNSANGVQDNSLAFSSTPAPNKPVQASYVPPRPDANPPGANLLGVNLPGANLLGVNLPGANLLGVNLPGVQGAFGGNAQPAPGPGPNPEIEDISVATTGSYFGVGKGNREQRTGRGTMTSPQPDQPGPSHSDQHSAVQPPPQGVGSYGQIENVGNRQKDRPRRNVQPSQSQSPPVLSPAVEHDDRQPQDQASAQRRLSDTEETLPRERSDEDDQTFPKTL